MAKLTIEIDLEDPQETWDALYRRIEAFGEEEPGDEIPVPTRRPHAHTPATYDLLLDPEHAFGDLSDFFSVFTGTD